MNLVEREVQEKAFGFPCPDCGAKAKIRCRILRPNITNPTRTTVDVRPRPCAGRVQVAWRQWLSEHYGVQS